MSYLVLARKYRPQTFEDIIGQEPIAATLKRAIEQDRVAHAILLTGSRGVGKTSMARILSKALNCVTGPIAIPCNVCEVCTSITEGGDLDVIEIDGASNNRVDEIRELRDNVNIVSARSRYKIYIIDEIHMLSISAFNALLKTLEEPPPHVKFIFATTNPQKLPETIHSRCQRFDFRPIPEAKLRGALATICEREGVESDPAGIAMVARAGRGSMRDSLTILDQMLVACDAKLTPERVSEALGIVSQNVVFDLVDAMAGSDAREVLAIVARVHEGGRDLSTLVSQVVEHLRVLMMAVVHGGEIAGDHTPEEAERFRSQTANWDLDRILYAIQILGEAEFRLRTADHPRVVVESVLLRLSRWEDWARLEEILGLLRGGVGAGSDPPRTGAGRPRGSVASPRGAASTAGATVRRPPSGSRGPSPGGRGGEAEASAARPGAATSIASETAPAPAPGAGIAATSIAAETAPAPAPSAGIAETRTPESARAPRSTDPAARARPARRVEESTAELDETSETSEAAPPAPNRPDPPAELTLEGVSERWPELLGALQRAGKPSVAAFVRGGELSGVEGRTVTLAFPAAKRFVAKQFEMQDTKKLLDRCTEEVFGITLKMVPTFPPAEAKPAEEEPEPGRAKRRPLDPEVKRVLDLFDGRIVGREE